MPCTFNDWINSVISLGRISRQSIPPKVGRIWRSSCCFIFLRCLSPHFLALAVFSNHSQARRLKLAANSAFSSVFSALRSAKESTPCAIVKDY